MSPGEPSHDPTRRQLLAGTAGALSGSLAGCGTVFDDGSGATGGDDPAWAGWVPASLAENALAGAMHVDLVALRAEFPDRVAARNPVRNYLWMLSVGPQALDAVTTVTRLGAETVVLEGSIGPDDVRLAAGRGTGSYGEYSVYQGMVAVRDGVAIVGRQFRDVVDAREGQNSTILEADEPWPTAIGGVGSATVQSVRSRPVAPWELQGLSVRPNDPESVHLTVRAYFASAGAAESNRERVRESLGEKGGADPDGDFYEIQSTALEGNVVVVEATSANFSL